MTSLGFGVIEGFYGAPWSHDARLGMLRELASLGLDTYLYAPKNDAQHRSEWWRPLDGESSARLRELFDLGRELGVRVVYGIAPERILGGRGNVRARSFFRTDRDRDGLEDEPFERLEARLDEIVSLGGRSFALSFDDTWATFVPALATFARGLLHARVAHRTLARLRNRHDDAEVVLVPAIYHRRFEEMPRGGVAYLRGIASLGADIPIAWTGPNIFSRGIDPGDVRRLERETGLPIWIWSNAVTNDWLPLATGEPLGLAPRQKLSFGPPENLSAGLADVSRGVLLNGAREPELTKVSLSVLAELARDGARFEPAAAHARAISRVFGDEGSRVARTLYAFTKRHPFASPARFEGAFDTDLVRDFLAGRTGVGEVRARLLDLATLDTRAAAIARPLGDEIAPTARKIALLARAALLSLDAARATRDRDESAVRAIREARRATLAEARAIAWECGTDGLIELVGAPVELLVKRI